MDEGSSPGPGRVRGLIRPVTAVTETGPEPVAVRAAAGSRRAGHNHARKTMRPVGSVGIVTWGPVLGH
jgi:hypothetical protein